MSPTEVGRRVLGRRGDDLLTPDPQLMAALHQAAPGAVAARASDRLSAAHDASHYLLVPRAVVTPRDASQVGALLRVSAAQGVPLTFRSGGTSLSGQATNDGVLVDVRQSFKEIEVLDGGDRVRVQPGATVRAVNSRLVRYGRKLGPDPASEIACTIGGVVANNSSGMACGTAQNTYATLDSLILVLPSGTVVDTGAADADHRLRHLEPALYEGLVRLRDRVRSNTDSVDRIRRLFAIKNTMGYGLNSFLDHTAPIDLLTHLVVGSEGTLAFVAEATFRTVALHPFAATALLTFPDLASATGSLPALVEAEFATVELLDATSLRVAQRDPKAIAALRDLAVRDHAALLVEHQQPTAESLADRTRQSAVVFADLPLSTPAALSRDVATRAALWHIRKGLFTAVAGARPSGTTALLEDIAVPVAQLLPTCSALTALFGRHGYADSVVFGHAKDGNVHFLLNEDFDQPAQLERYLTFTEDLVDLVLGNGGTLKAEHGTGRIMAPYVRRQYGDELYAVMRALKALFDPNGLLNPGVLLDEDQLAHVRHLKSTPTVEEEVDRCVECGYCEPVCPSRDLTTTPRERIVLRREIARAREAEDDDLAEQLEAEYQYDGIDTCAVDGMCQTACPVLINTGDLTRRLRAQQRSSGQQRAWALAARHWDAMTRTAGTALSAAAALPAPLTSSVTRAGRAVLGHEKVPAWSPDLPGGGSRRVPVRVADADVVFFPSCTGTMFGPAEGGTGVRRAFLALCERAGVSARVPDGIAAMCCGTPWKSKGLTDGYREMRALVLPVLTDASDKGALPVVVDASSCTEGLMHLTADTGVNVVDAVAFLAGLLPQLPVARKIPSLVVHRTCSSTQLGIDAALLRVAAFVADEVLEPEAWDCCAFAGDRGLLHPELTATATRKEAAAVEQWQATAHASANRTCEIGMSRATGRSYRHVLEVLEQTTRPRDG